jgi:hypothetical protein
MFKKIKQTLLNQNSIGRYLSYAVGEVILIVIGILVAVSINNWNEEKQQKKVEAGIFEILVNDITQDTAEVNQILNFYDNRKATFLRVARQTLTKEQIGECEFCTNLVSDWKLLTINKRGIYQLNEYKNYNLSGQDSLIFDIVNFYTTLIDEVENFNGLIKGDITGNLTHWRDTYPWFHSFVADEQLSKEDLNYFGGSQEYRNRAMFHYVLIYKNYLPILQEFQHNAEAILKQLNRRRTGN